MAVTVKSIYQGDLICDTIHEPSGDVIRTVAPVDNGGSGEHFSPTDMVGASLASCFLTIAGLYAKKIGFDLKGASATVTKEMASNPRRISKLTMKVVIPNSQNLSLEQRKDLEKAASSCPVKQSLHDKTEVVVEYQYL